MSIGTCRFDQLATVTLGVKTFLNPFFYVDTDRVKQFGIEPQFLQPVFRTGDLQRDKFTQDANQTKLKIFMCGQTVDKLVGTGAAAYINWAETQRHTGKAGQVGGLWKDTPAVKPKERIWYQNQAMPPPARIVLLKAFDDTFGPLVLNKAIRVDQRFNQVNAVPGVDEDLLMGLLCSTWFIATVETFGRTALGQGALELPTQALRALPVPDIRNVPPSSAKAWKATIETLLAGKRLPVNEMLKLPAQRELDTLFLAALGLQTSRVDELHLDTQRMTRIRKVLAAGRGQMRREQFDADVDDVADRIAGQLRPLIQGRRFPQDFLPAAAKIERVDFGTATLDVHSEMMLGDRSVLVVADGNEFFDRQLAAPIAELILRGLQANQRAFDIPIDAIDAEAALMELDALASQLSSQLDDFASRAESGAQAVLRTRVEAEINFPISKLISPIPSVYDAQHGPTS
jgi:hypothetical protein